MVEPNLTLTLARLSSRGEHLQVSVDTGRKLCVVTDLATTATLEMTKDELRWFLFKSGPDILTALEEADG